MSAGRGAARTPGGLRPYVCQWALQLTLLALVRALAPYYPTPPRPAPAGIPEAPGASAAGPAALAHRAGCSQGRLLLAGGTGARWGGAGCWGARVPATKWGRVCGAREGRGPQRWPAPSRAGSPARTGRLHPAPHLPGSPPGTHQVVLLVHITSPQSPPPCNGPNAACAKDCAATTHAYRVAHGQLRRRPPGGSVGRGRAGRRGPCGVRLGRGLHALCCAARHDFGRQ